MPDWTEPCAGCPRKYGLRAISGDGPRPARILGIMERPGQDENRNGRVACGKTGQELDELYLPLAGLDRSEIRLCNTVLCGHESNKAPTDKEVAQCAPHHVPEEIERTNPECIVLMGATACSLVAGIRLDYMHGVPQHTSKVGELFGWRGWLIPQYHPAIGLHESRWMKQCIDDWSGLRCLPDILYEPEPPVKTTFYRHVRGASEVTAYMRNAGRVEFQPAMDTESHAGRPWSMQVSVAPDTGLLVRADDREGLDAVDHWFNELPYDIAMHHAAHDLEEARHMHVRVPRYRDTMQESYQLGNLPQGLKALAYRLFRHTMTSYQETVMPASIRALTAWMTEAYMIAQLDLTQTVGIPTRTCAKCGHGAAKHEDPESWYRCTVKGCGCAPFEPVLKKEFRAGELETLLTRLLRLTSEESEYDPWGSDKEPRLDAFWREPVNEWMVTHVEARLGKYPVAGIANCSLEEAVRYAVGDADWCGRVAVELQRRRQGAFQIHEGDRDA